MLLLAGLAVMVLLGGCGGASGASRGESAEGTNTTTFVRLELSPTNNSGVGGSATFAKAAAGTRVELEVWDLPEPHEIYLAHIHQGSCEHKKHPDAPEGETADRQGHKHRHHKHRHHEQEENDEATPEKIE